MLSLDKVKDLKVLVVGDAILDEYVYVTCLGKAVKEPALSAKILRREEFRGGVWAAAAHAANFCGEVSVSSAPIVNITRRYVEDTYLRKLFTLHDTRSGDVSAECDIGSYDCVIITDFGYGTLTESLINKIAKEARYLAVNAQTNAPNLGFNLITKYRRADYIVIDELEARLAAHDRDSPIEDVILKLGYRNIVVTLGKNGAVGFDGGFERQPSLTEKVTDTMGAGDAFLCVTAPFASVGASMKDLLRIGNAAGAVKVGIVGHRASVNKENLLERLAY
jgi:bifunctional ADP-heptose synthase (sugar kinase/adenylyltransferase)